jgi:hypothetical protein
MPKNIDKKRAITLFARGLPNEPWQCGARGPPSADRPLPAWIADAYLFCRASISRMSKAPVPCWACQAKSRWAARKMAQSIGAWDRTPEPA